MHKLISDATERGTDQSPAQIPGTPAGDSAPRRRRRPSDIPAQASEADRNTLQVQHEKADIFLELSASNYLEGIAGKVFGSGFKFPVFQAYRDRVLREAGDPTDPIEQLLLEEFLFNHHALGRLHLRASEATSPEAAKIYYAAAARMQGELRRLALALRLYRTPVQVKQFTVVKQQNLAQSQQIALVEQAPASLRNDSSINSSTQLVSNSNEVLEHVPSATISAQPQASSGRPPEPCQTRPDYGRGP